MDEPVLTEFQRTAEAKIRDLLVSRGGSIVEREATSARLPHMPEAETVVKIVTAAGDRIWLYEEEATFSNETVDERFERADYGTSDDLLNALLNCIERV